MNYFFDIPLAYIDPGSGLQIASSASPFIILLLSMLGALLWPFRFFLRKFKKRPLITIFLIVLCIILSVGVYRFINHYVVENKHMNKVIVLGMDGLDPIILEKMMEQGDLPHFKKLKDKGSFKRLQTVQPPQSPVAWSTFATGLNPGAHGIYDFIFRRAKDYLPDLALVELKQEKKINILGMKFPVPQANYVNRRKGVPFWQLTSNAHVSTTVLHCPLTFPAEEISGRMLSGMGVPDIRGTQGIFSFFTDNPKFNSIQSGHKVDVKIVDQRIDTFLRGPIAKDENLEVPLKIEMDADQKGISLYWQNHEEHLKLNEWSAWLRFDFKANASTKINAMTRFHLKSIFPHFELYATPLQFTPEKPIHPISYPNSYADKLKNVIGDYHTLGMPHDTWALNEGVIDEDIFLSQSSTILDEEEKMLKHELDRFKKGLFVFVIETPDRIQHMFWRTIDEKSPLYTKELAQKYGHVIPDMYKRMDTILKDVLNYVDKDTTLIVMSDHGFKSFRRGVHLNTWLREKGYLIYKDEYKQNAGLPLLEGVDWDRSKAYALGFGGIFLNIKGREGQGIINSSDQAKSLKDEMIHKLKDFRDPDSGELMVNNVYNTADIYEGEYMEESPDILVGFKEGYRASWQTALGAAPYPYLVEDNEKAWSGDHIMDAVLVPGIILSNKPISKEKPSLYDLSPTILKLFDIPIPQDQKGSDIFD